MYQINTILSKLNKFTGQEIDFPDVMTHSLFQLKELARDALTWGEINFLHQQAKKEHNENKMAELRILSRANPQLRNAIRLGIRPPPMMGNYNDLFPQRTNSFVYADSVASMFSPAAYLTELYREAKPLHPDASEFNLDKRRPDLSSVSLSQFNLDNELSTLTLSNELLMAKTRSHSGKKNDDEAMEMLSTYRQTAQTPYNQPYEAARQSIILQDPQLEAFNRNPAVATLAESVLLLSIHADISPELNVILTETIGPNTADVNTQITKNFGDEPIELFRNSVYVAHWYGLSYDELNEIIFYVTGSNNTLENQADSNEFKKTLLKLNKFIRLYKATGVNIKEIITVVESNNQKKDITPTVLEQFFFANHYVNHYGIDTPIALVLSGANIGQTDYLGQDSLFTRLFNTPMLDNKKFTADNTLIDPLSGDSFNKSVIKRALGVNDTELYMLGRLVTKDTEGTFTSTIDNLSALLRTKLLAEVHGLTVRELEALLAISSPDLKAINKISKNELSALVGSIDSHTQWLTDMGWTVSALYLMLTDTFSTTLSPDIENLVATLKNGLANQDFDSNNEAASITAAAPLIAATTQLNSVETADAVLRWLSQLKPKSLTVVGFLKLVNENTRTATETTNMVAYCQVMGQLALIVRSSELNASELAWVVSHPSIFNEQATQLPHNIDTLYKLTQLHALLNRCGPSAAEILTSLSGSATSQNNLAVNTLATALSLDEQALTQALAQCSNRAYFYNWISLSDALQWLDVASTLGITPDNVKNLIDLPYATEKNNTTGIYKAKETYDKWTTASRFLQAGLDTEQTPQLNATLDEKLSQATSSYVIKNDSPQWVTNRDALYNWLLIDNQVSAQIKTTRIAEAIASVQLYVNRALSGQENGVVSTAKSKAFFSDDWDTYNKRYSTWAGVSQLVYFPENYIDPTLRIGQTGMMDEMLQSLSQSQLTRDTVEDAFKTYMTRFEEIANLDITSGYHDSTFTQDGTTYLIGKSAIGDYYWRSADISQLSDGKLPANAWREWKKITVGMTPEKKLIRPVIFQSRLYIIWVESKELAVMTKDVFVEQSTDYLLKYAHIQHDGTWSSPISVALDNTLLFANTDIENTGMYCAKDFVFDILHIYFYKKDVDYQAQPELINGINLHADGKVETKSAMAIYIYSQFDTTQEVRLNTPYTTKKDIITATYEYNSTSTNYSYTYVDSQMLQVSSSIKGNNAEIVISMTAAVVYDDTQGSAFGEQVRILKAVDNIDGEFYFNNTYTYDNARIFGKLFSCIYYYGYGNKSSYDIIFTENNTKPQPVGSRIFFKGSDSPEYSGNSKLTQKECVPVYEPYKNINNMYFTKMNKAKMDAYVAAFSSVPNSSINTEYPLDFQYTDFKRITLKVEKNDVKVYNNFDDNIIEANETLTQYVGYSLFGFPVTTFKIPLTAFKDDWYDLKLTIKASPSDPADSRTTLGTGIHFIALHRQSMDDIPVISLKQTSKGAQYLQYDNNRIRVNTLFARQLVERANLGINAVLSMDTQCLPEPSIQPGKENSQTEPMDFNGANAIYFWEMFYYVPMMVFQRLLIENKFTEATQWIKYVWSPDGYLTNGQPANYTWNVRPLEEETSWHSDQLDSVDPDAVAQADPMHYKLATFMSWLDLLIARGDTAYRQLERDTLNEAKMWYVQALYMLGDAPYATHDADWKNPQLKEAASQTVQKERQQAMLMVRQQRTSDELRTANTLIKLFVPQLNEKLAAYWQTLTQRLYNLRHNLSIEGNPLSLSLYTPPANPAALLSAAVNAYSGSQDLPPAVMPLYRFPVILDSARNIVNQLSQFGSSLLSLSERQDAEAMSELLQTQGAELVLQSIAMQNTTLHEIDEDRASLEESLRGAQSRLDSYTTLYDEDVSAGEKEAMALAHSASVLSTTATVSYTVAAGLDALPNIYGFACGGAQYGSISRAIGYGTEIGAGASRVKAENISQIEIYRRRRQEWKIQRDAAQSDVAQIRAQLAALAVRREGAMLQKVYLETQKSQTQVQMTFLQNKFTSKALYNWLRGKLSAIYYQYYDLAVSRCLMAEEAYKWATGADSASFIRPGAWQGTYAGLMAGETLMLNLTQMEQSWLQKDQREKEVVRTVCLSEVYAGLPSGAFNLAEKITAFVEAGKGSAGVPNTNSLSVTENDKQLHARLKLSDLKINDDYPASLGDNRNIKQISVTLPALVGPYQDVRAMLSYGGSKVMPRGCNELAVSHGMNDSGQFQLDFNDGRWLPFEGIPVNDNGTLTLSFPQIDSRQKALLLSLTDIILHIRYTIRL